MVPIVLGPLDYVTYRGITALCGPINAEVKSVQLAILDFGTDISTAAVPPRGGASRSSADLDELG